jgi:hypothetical protein
VLVVLFAGAAVYQLLVRLVLGLLVGPWDVWITASGLKRFHSTTTARVVLVAAVPYVFSLVYSVLWVASGQSTFWEFLFGGGTMFPTE